MQSDLKRFKKAVISYSMHSPCEKAIKFMDHSEQNYSTREERFIYSNTGSWPSATVKSVVERGSQGQQNNKIGPKVLKFPRTSFSVRAKMLIKKKDSLHLMIIPWHYVIQQLWVLVTGLKNQERELSHLLKLYKAQKKPSLIIFYTKTDLSYK